MSQAAIRKNFLFGAVAALFATGLFFTQEAEAFQVKRVIRGSVSLSSNEITSLDLTTPTDYLGGTLLDTTKTLVFATFRSSSNEPDTTHTMVTLDDEQTISFVRFNASTSVEAEFQIVEFVSGVTIMSGITVFGDCTGTACRSKTITLPQDVDLSKSLAFLTWKSYSDLTASTEDEKHTFTADFTAKNKLRIRREGSSGSEFGDVYYQVVEFDEGVSVQSGLYQTGDADTSYATSAPYTTGTVSVTNGSKTVTGSGTSWTSGMTGYMFEVGGSGNRYKFTYSSATSGTIEPAYEGTTASGQSYELGEFLDVNTAKSILFETHRGGNGAAGVENYIHADAVMTDTDTLTFTRPNGGSTNDLVAGSWFVLTFTEEGYTQNERVSIDPNASTNEDRTLVETEMARTLSTYARTLNYTTTGATLWADLQYTMQQTSNTNLRFIRAVTGQPTYVSWGAAEFPPVKLLTPNGGQTLNVGDTYDITWDLADELKTGGSCSGTYDAMTIQIYLNSAWRDIITNSCTGIVFSNNSATYSWTIPETVSSQNVITSTARIRVLAPSISVGTPDRNYDDSNANFTIKGSISNVAPGNTSGLVWSVGQSGRTITWSHTGSLGDVKITLDTDGDGDFTDTGAGGAVVLIDDADNVSGSTGTVNWNSSWDSGAERDDLKLKVELISDSTVNATSANEFEIRPSLALTAPAAAAEWNRGLQKNITWTTTGSVGNVDIWLSYNTGSTYTKQLASNYSGGSPYVWNIEPTETLSDNCKIAVVRTGQSPSSFTVGDITPDSSDVFKIIASLTLTNPLAAQNPPWRVGQDQTIAWTVGGGSGVTNVDLLYRTDCSGSPNCGGTTTGWTAVPNGTNISSTSPFTWTNLPAGVQGTATGIRIQDNSNPSNIYDQVGPFNTKAALAVTNPTGSSIWRVGSNQTISFTKAGTTNNLTVDWGTDGGSSWPNNLATNVSGLTVPWNNIPSSAISDTLSIKIYDPSDSNPTTGVAVVSPTFKIKPDITNVVLSTGCPGSCTPGTVFKIGDTVRVTWSVAPVSHSETVDVKISTNSGGAYNTTLGSATASTGYFDWTIPDNASYVTNTLRIRVIQQTDSAVYADSGSGSSDFQVKGGVTITDPTGPWKLGTTQNIDFTKTAGVTGVDIIYALDGSGVSGGTFNDPSTATKTVVTNYTGASPYAWDIPNDALDISASSIYNDIKTSIKFRVKDNADSTTNATATNNITMRKQYTSIGVPSATLYVDDNTLLLSNISWTTKGNTDVTHPVKLFYSVNDGVDGYPNPIPAAGTALSDTGGYIWQVPDSIGSGRKIRVKSSTDPTTVYDDMATNFTIRGKIDQLVPTASGVVYDYNSPITISWYNHGTLGPVTIKLATDGTNFNTTLKANLATTANAANNWVWNATNDPVNFPPAVGSTYKIKVEQDSDNTNVFATSANNFRVKGVLALTTANADGLWAGAGTSKDITWTKSPSNYADNQIRLYYSTSAAITNDLAGCQHASWVVIPPDPNTTTGSPATWNWSSVAQGAISNTFHLKVQDGTDCTQSYDISDAANAIVRGSIASVTATGSPWLIGETKNISWTSTPSAQGDVLVELSLNGGAYQPITGVSGTSTVASQTSPFPWTIQEGVLSSDYEANAMIRVKLVSDPNNVVDEIDAPITIKKRYTSVAVPSSTLVVGEPNSITWNTQGNTGVPNQVLLSYDTSSGSGGFTGQINSGNPLTDNESYSWTVPDSIGNNRVVRVSSNAFPAQVYGDSGTFSIKGKVVPDSGIDNYTLVVGQPANIVFAKSGTIGNLKIEYIHNGNSTVITPGPVPGPEGTDQATTFNWSSVVATDSAANSVIDVGGSQNSTFKFTGLTHAGTSLEASATSANFQVRGNLENERFDGSGTEGQVLYIGSSYFVEWKPTGNIGNIRVRMDRYGGLGVNGTPNDGDEFQDVLTGPDATYPNAESVPYNYQIDGNGYARWEWTVPNVSSNNVLIRVESLDNPWHATNPMATYVMTSSATPFRIRGTYSNVTPTSAVKWKVTSLNNLDWTASATSMGNVNLTLRYDSDANGTLDATYTIVNNTSTKPYPWTIDPSLVTEKAVVRVQQTSDGTGTVYNESQEFKIKPKLQLLLPNSNADQWVVGSQYDITWAAPVGSASAFKVNISTDGGTTWNDGAVTSANKGGEIVASTASAALEYPDWTVPDIMTNQGMIRIRKVGDSDIEATDDSDAFFYVKGSITNVHIKNNAGDADPSVPIDLPIATTKYVTWNYTGSLGTVELSYSTDADQPTPTYTPITTGTCAGAVSVGTGGSGSCSWVIPNSPSPNVRVKVTSTTNANWQTVNGLSFASAGPDYNDIIGSITAVSVVSDGFGTDAVVGANPKTILWTPNGAIATFDIFYRYDGGSWTEIANNVAGTVSGSDRTWAWNTIPDTISSDVDYRVVDHANPTKTFLDSTAAYRIRGSIDLTNPNGSNTLTIGTPYNITWTKTGSIGNIKIEMSTDNFTSDIRTIIASYDSANSPYAWTPSATVAPVINYADMNADIVKIRVTSIGGIPVSDPSANPFKIIGQITNVQPTGSGNIWYKGESRNITWSQIGNIGAVDIFYRTSGGATPYDIEIVSNHTGHTNGANSYTWNPVHDVNSEDVWIQVKDHNNPNTVLANSAAAFSVRPTLTVTGPVSTDVLVVGSNQPNIIKWTTDGTVGGGGGTVKILYDSGSGYLDPANVIADNVPVGNGTAGITWNPIPNAVSSTVKVKVVDKSNASVFDESAVFKIKGSITLSSPQGGLHWVAADTGKTVTWSMTGTLPALDVEYNLAGGVGGWTSIGQAGAGNTSINWSPLPTTATNAARVRVKADYADNDLDITTTGTDFFIENAFSNLLPTNGTVVKVGDTLPHITWNVGAATGITAVKIEYSNNQSAGTPTWTQITDTAPNTGDFAWTWPGTLADLNNDARLRITQWNPQNPNTTFTATGSAFLVQPTITITEPVADVSWGVNTTRDIKFTKRGAIQTVNIYYAADGSNYDPTPINAAPINISALADDTVYTYNWLIDANTALTAGYAGKIKVKVNTPGTQTAVEQPLAAGVELEIKGTLTLNTPTAAGITLYVGDTYNDITWTKFGAITNVDLHYSTDGGSTYPNLIADNIASTPSVYAWTVPNSIDGDIKVRVRDHNNPNNVFAVSANNFRILGKVAVTTPDLAGITWVVGQTNKAINWTSTGTYASVDIDLARDGNFANTGNYGATSDPNITNIGTFSNCTPVNPAITCNGTANWAAVTDVITGTAKIRVRDAGFPTDVQDESNNTFKIIGSFTGITSPAASAVWNYPDTTKEIRWAANGTMTNVKIEYKTSAGGSYTTIAANDPGHTSGNNTYVWSAGLPDVNTDDAYIKVTDLTVAGSTASIEAGPFSIRPTITVSDPTNGQELVVGTNYPNLIKWSRTGTTISTVKILYSTDGSSFPDPANLIADNVPVGDGVAGVSWNIPASLPMVSTAKIRVLDKDNPNVYDDSSPFVLKGGLTLTAPSGSGTTIIAGSTTNSVTWTYKGDFSVEVRYDPNSGLGADGLPGTDDYPTLIGTKPAPGNNSGANSINWDLSAGTGTNTTTVTNKGHIKIFNPADPTGVVSESAADFSVGGQFDVLTPENGAIAYAEDPYLITWTPVAGTGISNIKIEYSNNSEDSTPTWTEIDAGTTKANTGSYNWTAVPGALADLNNTNRIRVSQKTPLNAATVDIGTGSPFSIKPALEVTKPGNAGNETLNVGTAYPIKMKKKGAVQSVDFYYSYDGTPGNYVKINGAAVDVSGAADGNGEYTFNWTPQESHTLTSGFVGKIKAKVVTPTTQVSVEDVQSNGIKLSGGLVLNTPSASGVILEVSDTYAITWTKYSVSNVRLFYSTNGGIAGGGTYPPDGSPNITTVAATPASYNWTVPDQIGSNLRVRIMDDDNALVAVESANAFQIRGKLILDTPLNGTTQRVDDTVDLKWTPKGTMSTVKLEYSTDNFTLPGNIFPVLGPLGESAANLPAGTNNVQQTFTWKIPDNISNTVRVRVVNNADANVKGTSTSDFKIVGWFDLTDPLGGVGVFKKVDDPFSVTWVRHGSIAQAKVEYSTDGFQTEPANVFLIGTVNSPTQSVSWTIPDAIGTNVKVRVSDPAYNGTTVFTQPSTSAAFEIRGQIKLNPSRTVPGPDSPLGGEIWLIGSDHMLQWEKHGTIGNVEVQYQVGGGGFNHVADASSTQATSVAGDTFNWRIPNQKGLNNVVVRVRALGDNNVTVTSNTFTIRAGFTWTNPNAAGVVFEQGTTPTLTWNTNGTVPTVDLKYSTNGDAVYDGDSDPNYVFMKDTLGNNADNISNNNTFNWPVPTNINASKDVYFVVVDTADADAQNVTPKVKIAGVLTMDEPDNSPTVERWGVTTNQTIAWTMVGNVANVKIEYTKDITAGTPVWEAPAIASSVVASNLSYNWTNIPTAAVSAKAAIRVSDVISDSGTAPAISPLFKITGTFTPTAPTAGTVWYTTGTSGAMNNPTRNITWSTQGSIAQADLYYSTTGNTPGAWTLINTGGPIADGGAGGSYAWTVPQVFSDNMVIRIQDHDDSLTYYDTGVFTVRGHINLTSPVGGEPWGVGEVQSITWDSVGVVGSPNEVYLYYKKSAGGAWIQLQRPTLEYNIPNTGTFAWTPPESELSTAAYVKIENIIAPTDPKYVSTESPASFKLMRRYELVDPDGGEIYTAGQAKDITWNKWGTPAGDVRIDLALDGVNFTTNIVLTTPNDGVYSWTPLASQVAPAAKIRIRDVNDTANEKAYISSSPFVVRATLILDAMPATVNIGDVYDILWTRQGDIPNAKIVYTTTGNFALDSRLIEDLNGNTVAGGLVPNQDTVSGNPTRGRHRWKVPDLILSERTNLQIRIVDPNDDPGSENISGQFRILPKFTVTTPNGNADPNLTDKLKVGVPYNITWTSTSSSAADKTPNVTILYSTNGGGSYPNTITTTANDGSYSWFVAGTGGVPDDISDQVKVKVVSANAAEAAALAEDPSDNNIKIISNFTLTTPNGGATYEVGDPLTIAWTKIGSAANVQLSYSTNGSDFSSPVNIGGPTPNDLSEAWAGGLPDAIGNNVRVRVKSTTDDGDDISDASFRIKGKLTVTAPAASTPVPIGQNYLIQWTTNGTIPNVNIVYDIQDGAGNYPYTIATNIPNTGSYNWTNVPDTGTADARIRVIDARPSESDVIGTSAKFNIVGNFTVLTPANLEELVVNSSYNVTWHWGGTIQFVKLSYTTNPALAESVAWTNITTIDYGPASGDGANGTATRTYTWTVPDNIAPSVRFKVENANDSSVYDVSTGTFRIKGGFTLQSPTGGERWITNEVRDITWLTDGTVPFVNLEYSHDNFATAGIPIASNIPNNASGLTTTYSWTIPDPGIANVPKSTKLRVVNAADPTNYLQMANPFNIDYYNITWEIRDLVTNASLSQLTVNEVKASDPNFIQWSEAGISTNPPRVQPTPYGTWVATWSKAGFGDGVQVVVANADQNILLYMETSTVHIWLADSQVSYDPTADTLSVVAWLSRDGSITTGAVDAKYKIYDGSTLLYTVQDTTVDAAGFFNFNVPAPTGFVAGKTYNAICEVTVGSGGVFKTPTSFEVTTPKTLKDVQNTINANIDKPLSQINTELQTTLNAQTATIRADLAAQTAIIQTTLDNFTDTIEDSIVSLESAADESLQSAEVLKDTALKFSWKAVVAPNPALSGTTVVLQAQGPTGLSPICSVYNNRNDQVIINGAMQEDPANPGNYSYSFPAAAADFEAGQAYTFIVTEDVTGGLVAGSGFIESISLTSVAGLAAAAPAAEKAAKEAVKAIKELENSMAKGGDIKDTMKLLRKAVEDLQYTSQNTPERENKLMRERVAEITEQLRQLAGDQGLNFDQLFKKAIDESSSIQEIRSNTGSLNQAVELIGAVVEKRLGGVEEPIVDVQLEPAS